MKSQPIGQAFLRDGETGRWLGFARPSRVLTTSKLQEVLPVLQHVESAVRREKRWAAGFIAYEAAPAFDPALAVRDPDGFPLVWFGLYDKPMARRLRCLPSGLPFPAVEWQPSVAMRNYARLIRRIQEYIRQGDTYQVNFTYRLRAPLETDPWRIFRRMAAAQAPPFGAFVDTGDWAVCSASPELFFRMGDGWIESRPMKGTRPRGFTIEGDQALARALQRSEKDQAENVMIVDMVRNDIGRIAEPGTVEVSRLFDIERYPTVWQMTSTVRARTRASLVRVFQALFPPASITGAPKPRTMEIIRELESTPRHIYTGCIGFARPDGAAQFNVAIRTLLFDRRTRQAEYGIGGGIVWDSRPKKEWEESRTKARVLELCAPSFRLLETLRWTPAEGYFLLDRHLRRLARSAAFFGFRVRPDTVRLRLEDAAARFGRMPRRVRLLVARNGRIAIEVGSLPCRARRPIQVPLARRPVDSRNRFLYHKTTSRGIYEAARAERPGWNDVLLFNTRGEITESTIANVVVEIGVRLYTPPARCGLLAGTFRAQLLEEGRIAERVITVREALRSRRVYLTNSVRGMYRIAIVNPDE